MHIGEVHLDKFYSDLLANNVNRQHLWTVVKLVLVLSHGNASVERGFSVNKELLIENMLEETVVSQMIADREHARGDRCVTEGCR